MARTFFLVFLGFSISSVLSLIQDFIRNRDTGQESDKSMQKMFICFVLSTGILIGSLISKK